MRAVAVSVTVSPIGWRVAVSVAVNVAVSVAESQHSIVRYNAK